MKKEDIENEIKKQLGLSLGTLSTGTAPLDISHSPEKEKRSDVGKKKPSRAKHSNIRVETTNTEVFRPGERQALDRIKEEAQLELGSERDKRARGEFKVSEDAKKFLAGNLKPLIYNPHYFLNCVFLPQENTCFP